eukprot:1181602-Prorocentrum_minimum.AAC.1
MPSCHHAIMPSCHHNIRVHGRTPSLALPANPALRNDFLYTITCRADCRRAEVLILTRSALFVEGRLFRGSSARARAEHRRSVGLRTAVKPLLSHSTTGEFEKPPKYSRTPKKRQRRESSVNKPSPLKMPF